MDAFELLKTDHEKVSQLFKEIESASGAAKRDLFTRLKGELDVHAHIEEKVLYPALENTEEAREITLEAYEEHKVVKDLLAELDSAGKINDEWDAKLTVLKENVEHHVEEEENELFSKARKALSEEEIDRIGSELEAEKAAAQGAPGKTPRAARSGKKAVGQSTPAKTGTSGSRGRSSKDQSQSESPGVLRRIANFIGLGESPAPEPKVRKTSTGKGASKTSASKGTAASKAAKRAPAKAKSAAKSATKSVAKPKVKAAAKRTSSKKAGKTRVSVSAETSRANKRQSASGGRKSAKTAASRSSSKKATGRTSAKRKQAR